MDSLFRLACDWLKECGYHNYGKPDTHTVDILFGTGVAQCRDNYEVLKTMVRMGRVNDEVIHTQSVIFFLYVYGQPQRQFT